MKTQSFNSASSNLGATIKQSMSMIMGKDVSNFTLVFLDPTVNNAANSSQMFVVPNITIGRAGACHVRYGDQYSSVSRQHASITGNNNQYYLNHNQAATNPTYVNGAPISGPHLLQNGDTIQFSQNGPRARFNVSNTKTSTIGVTGRVNRAMGQAIRPYRKAIAVMSLLLLGSIGALGFNFFGDKETKGIAIKGKETADVNTKAVKDHEGKIATINETIDKANEALGKLTNELVATRDSLTVMNSKAEVLEKEISENKKRANYSSSKMKEMQNMLSATNKRKQELEQEVAVINKRIGRTAADRDSQVKETTPAATSSSSATVQFDDLPTDNVYQIYAISNEITHATLGTTVQKDKYLGLYTGTAFLTSDSKLITARHVVQPYRFGQVDVHNLIESNGGRIITTFKAVSKNGDSFTFNSKNAVFDDSSDEIHNLGDGQIVKTAPSGNKDWAYIPIASRTGKISLNKGLAKNLKWGTKLYVVGYTYGDRLQNKAGDAIVVSPQDLKPLLTETMVAQNGLTNGVIHTSLVGFGPGNSGGPVFAKTSNGFEAVGIVSGGVGSAIGVITPISQLR